MTETAPEPAFLTITTSFPNDGADGTVFTDEAIAGLVGQTPMLTASPGDLKSAVGRAKIVAAKQEGGRIVLTIEARPEIAATVDLTPGIGVSYVREREADTPGITTIESAMLLEGWAQDWDALSKGETPQ